MDKSRVGGEKKEEKREKKKGGRSVARPATVQIGRWLAKKEFINGAGVHSQ